MKIANVHARHARARAYSHRTGGKIYTCCFSIVRMCFVALALRIFTGSSCLCIAAGNYFYIVRHRKQ